jgi:hypothetical protein
MPSDVRRGYAAPFNLEVGDGLRPRFGLARISLAKGRTKGQALRYIEPLTARHSRASHPAAEPVPARQIYFSGKAA